MNVDVELISKRLTAQNDLFGLVCEIILEVSGCF